MLFDAWGAAYSSFSLRTFRSLIFFLCNSACTLSFSLLYSSSSLNCFYYSLVSFFFCSSSLRYFLCLSKMELGSTLFFSIGTTFRVGLSPMSPNPLTRELKGTAPDLRVREKVPCWFGHLSELIGSVAEHDSFVVPNRSLRVSSLSSIRHCFLRSVCHFI